MVSSLKNENILKMNKKQRIMLSERNFVIDSLQNEGFPIFGKNHIKTSKYNLLTFIPLNLFYQFTKIANVYFFVLTIL